MAVATRPKPGADDLARKKTERRASRDPDTWKIKPIAATIRGSAEWKGWLEGLAKAHRQSVAGLIDTALARLAKEIGYKDPPER